jgi:hypothetical protein
MKFKIHFDIIERVWEKNQDLNFWGATKHKQSMHDTRVLFVHLIIITITRIKL